MDVYVFIFTAFLCGEWPVKSVQNPYFSSENKIFNVSNWFILQMQTHLIPLCCAIGV